MAAAGIARPVRFISAQCTDCVLAAAGSPANVRSGSRRPGAPGPDRQSGAARSCDAYGTEQIGSVATYGTETLPDGSTVDSVTVSPVDGQVCTESHVEFACVTG